MNFKNIKLAWRNILRNKKRTIITVASIFFAILMALCMRSFQLGSYSHMIKNVIETYIGYVQIQHKEYFDDKVLENSIEYNQELIDKIKSDNNVIVATPRIETMALASSGDYSKAALIMCILPEEENRLTKLTDRLVKYRLTPEAIAEIKKEDIPEDFFHKLDSLENSSYSNTLKIEIDFDIEGEEAEKYIPLITKHSAFKSDYLKADDDGILIADRMAKYLGIDVGDTLILIGQGYQGASATDIFPVRGILKFPTPTLDNMLIYMTLNKANDYLSVGNKITSVTLSLDNTSDKGLEETAENLKQILGDEYAVKTWKQLNKELVQQIKADEDSGFLMIYILYLIIAFGILGTVLMMTAERKREFGMMVAVGMSKLKLASIIILEMIFIGLLGIVSGIAASIPIILYFVSNPIRLTGEMAATIESYGMEPLMPVAWQADFFIAQSLVMIVIILIATLYPLIKILRLKEVKALRG